MKLLPEGFDAFIYNFQEDNHATFGSKKNFAPSSLDGKEVREDIDSMKRLIKSHLTAHV